MTDTPHRPEKRVLLLTLSERISAKGTTYLTGWMLQAGRCEMTDSPTTVSLRLCLGQT